MLAEIIVFGGLLYLGLELRAKIVQHPDRTTATLLFEAMVCAALLFLFVLGWKGTEAVSVAVGGVTVATLLWCLPKRTA